MISKVIEKHIAKRNWSIIVLINNLRINNE